MSAESAGVLFFAMVFLGAMGLLSLGIWAVYWDEYSQWRRLHTRQQRRAAIYEASRVAVTRMVEGRHRRRQEALQAWEREWESKR